MCTMPHVRCQISGVTCQVSHVNCHVSCVMCHVSCVLFSSFLFIKWWSNLLESPSSTGPTLLSLLSTSNKDIHCCPKLHHMWSIVMWCWNLAILALLVCPFDKMANVLIAFLVIPMFFSRIFFSSILRRVKKKLLLVCSQDCCTSSFVNVMFYSQTKIF